MKRILFVIGSLKGGGAEKVLLETVKGLNKEKYSITVMPIWEAGIYLEEMKSYVKVIGIFHGNWRNKWLEQIAEKLMMRIFRLIPAILLHYFFIREKYEIEIAFIEGMSTKIVSGSTKKTTKLLAWVHADMQRHTYSTFAFASLKQEKKAYHKFDQILCVSNLCKKSFEEKYGCTAKVQYNVLDEQEILRKAEEPIPQKFDSEYINLISVGRLSYEKGYLRLLIAFSKLNNAKLRLYILGEGEQKSDLEKKIEEYHLQEQVYLLGFQKNPYAYMKRSDIFVCSSYSEGFSTVATEAIILGMPIVTTACAGMQDLLGDSEYGIICPNNEEGLLQGLNQILNVDERQKYTEQARLRSSYFKKKKRIQEIEKLL
ncbi:MAG: glycosyltransferase [Lachnospiraceae bacterium]|nr:glycosyltransferase [Lachnospiraceae bacterium]